MGGFNKRKIYASKNFEDDKCYNISPELDLYSTICTSILQSTFYIPSTNDQLNIIKSKMRKVDDEFIAKLAIYAREEMYLRSIPLVLTVELAKRHRGDNLIRKLVSRVISRADEITEILGYYISANPKDLNFNHRKDGSKIPKRMFGISNQFMKGVADSFKKFNEYQFSKYNRKTEIQLRDVLNITHPKPENEEMSSLFRKILDRKLETPYTWEVELSKAGQTKEDKKTVWENLIDSKKMGYMATLRNLRNFVESGVSIKHLGKVFDYISNPIAVSKSKQLPFRFLSAYKIILECDKSSILLNALEEAVKYTVNNFPMFDNESILIASDVSGSMYHPISEKSNIMNFDIGILLSMILKNKCKNVTTGMFGEIWKVIDYPETNILKNTINMTLREGEVGYSTNGWKVLSWANNEHKHYDRIMIFTDGQMWNSDGSSSNISDEWKKYKKTNPNSKLYLFNLMPYGDSPVDLREGNVCLISGWSDKIFNVLSGLEKGENILNDIRSIKI